MKFDDKGLIPAIIQDFRTRRVLMMAYMNQEAFDRTLVTGKVWFWSRSRNCLWLKGETSNNYLHLREWRLDCDEDALLISAEAQGPCCHTGSDTCWKEKNEPLPTSFLERLEDVIRTKKTEDPEKSYTASLFRQGINKIAQKLGEEAVELVIESKDDSEELFLGEAADLMFHYLVLLQSKGHSLRDVVEVLKNRHKP